MITKHNFYVASDALFEPCETPSREPDVPSESGSEYWFEGEYLIRRSDHWGHVAACRWALVPPIGITLVPPSDPKHRAMNTVRDGELVKVTARARFDVMTWITTSQFAELPRKKRKSMLYVFPEHTEELKRRYNL